MSIEQACVIVHNAYVGSQIKPPNPPAQSGSQRALQAELTDAGGLDVAGGSAQGVDGPSRAEIEAEIARQKANDAWAARQRALMGRAGQQDLGLGAAGDDTIIRLAAPERGAAQVNPEAVAAFGQHENQLAVFVGYVFVAGIGSPSKT
jgi:hypothetical protein